MDVLARLREIGYRVQAEGAGAKLTRGEVMQMIARVQSAFQDGAAALDRGQLQAIYSSALATNS